MKWSEVYSLADANYDARVRVLVWYHNGEETLHVQHNYVVMFYEFYGVFDHVGDWSLSLICI